MQPSEQIWMNGEFVPWEDAQVHVLTHALHYGTSVFEGVRCYDTEIGPAIFRHQDHVDRLFRSGEAYFMDIPYTPAEVRSATLELIARNGMRSCYIRPIAYRGYGSMGLFPLGVKVDVTIACWEWGLYLGEQGKLDGIRAKISRWRRISPDALIPHAKAGGQYLNSILAKVEAHNDGYDEAILLDHHGDVCEGTGENIFVIRDGVISTPAMSSSILEGISRDSIIKIAADLGHQVIERVISADELELADEIFLTGTAAEMVPVRELEGRPVGSGKPGEITSALQEVYEDALYGRDERYLHWLDPVPTSSMAASDSEAGSEAGSE